MDNNRDEEEPFVAAAAASVDNSETLRNHTKDVHILSSAFLLIFLAYGAAQNLETTLNTVRTLYIIYRFPLAWISSFF